MSIVLMAVGGHLFMMLLGEFQCQHTDTVITLHVHIAHCIVITTRELCGMVLCEHPCMFVGHIQYKYA